MTMRRPTARVNVVTVDGAARRTRPDRIVTEEPLKIRVHGPGEAPVAVAVTLRTPGHDFELALGFCVAEGLLAVTSDLATVEYCLGGAGEQEYNVVTVARRSVVGDSVRQRTFAATASCGLCGKTTIDDLVTRCDPVDRKQSFAWDGILAAIEGLSTTQASFATTGGLHAAALFDASGAIVVAREDVGRHNALDKIVGHRFLAGELPVTGHGVALSGRIGFELVQKAAVIGAEVVAAIGAPSSLAVDTARELGLTLIGFVRDGRANVYTHPERLAFEVGGAE